MSNLCFLFGHSNTPHHLLPLLQMAVEHHYVQHNIRTYVVGNHGTFDQLATTAVKGLKQQRPDVTLLLLLSRHPQEQPPLLSPGFDGSFYPPLENVPPRYALVRANRYMVHTADSIICYANHPGNARKLWEYACRQPSRPLDNLALQQSTGLCP